MVNIYEDPTVDVPKRCAMSECDHSPVKGKLYCQYHIEMLKCERCDNIKVASGLCLECYRVFICGTDTIDLTHL